MTRDALARLYARVRAATERLTAPLAVEDQVVQSMPDASPTKWHLGHTTWFFETFVLATRRGHRAFDERFAALHNSYYRSVGEPHPRAARGFLSRPTVDEVRAWRRSVDEQMQDFCARCDDQSFAALAPVIEVGINHEEQHQELIVTDVKHVLASNPLAPAIKDARPGRGVASALGWSGFDGGPFELGHAGDGFAYDNELARHRVWLQPFSIATRLVTCSEWCEFIRDGGYRRPELWLSDGWDACVREGWRAPLYWRGDERGFRIATFAGERALEPNEPVCHVSFFEAEAFARWAGARLPTEAEWERAATSIAPTGNFVESGELHPLALAEAPSGIAQLFGDVWEWTASGYLPYPGYRPFQGALSEYNGKFMCNQFVLRGGSCATPSRHIRASYRNFFSPAARWQFSGVRLAR
jgi:ergothioneine biosynthesis protein EgtB